MDSSMEGSLEEMHRDFSLAAARRVGILSWWNGTRRTQGKENRAGGKAAGSSGNRELGSSRAKP